MQSHTKGISTWWAARKLADAMVESGFSKIIRNLMSEVGVYRIRLTSARQERCYLRTRSHVGLLTNSEEIAKILGMVRFEHRDEGDPKLVTSIFEGLIKLMDTGKARRRRMEALCDRGSRRRRSKMQWTSTTRQQSSNGTTTTSRRPCLTLKIKAARRDEVDFIHGFRVYRKVPRASAVGGQAVCDRQSGGST